MAGKKTQTRRIIMPQPEHVQVHDYKGQRLYDGEHRLFWWKTLSWALMEDMQRELAPWCPHGWKGDRLWVKETHYRFTGVPPAVSEDGFEIAPDGDPYQARIYADHPQANAWRDAAILTKVPSIHMPRWASRLTLEITAARVERLQDISKEDAQAEGLSTLTKDGSLYKYGIPDRDGWPGTDDDGWTWSNWHPDPRQAFRRLWDSINSDRASWASNPWVWVIEFLPLSGD